MEQEELIKRYDDAILKIAKKVAGSQLDIVDDLCQIGRITLLKLYPQNQRWAFLSKAIKSKMLDYAMENTTVRIPRDHRERHGLKSVSVELAEDLATQDRDYTSLPEMGEILEEIELDIAALPEKDKRLCRAMIKTLEGKRCRISTKEGVVRAKALVADLATKYIDRYQRLTA